MQLAFITQHHHYNLFYFCSAEFAEPFGAQNVSHLANEEFVVVKRSGVEEKGP